MLLLLLALPIDLFFFQRKLIESLCFLKVDLVGFGKLLFNFENVLFAIATPSLQPIHGYVSLRLGAWVHDINVIYGRPLFKVTKAQ